MREILEKLVLPEIKSATDEDITAHLRRSCQIAEIAAIVEREQLILNICQQLDITVSEEDLQAAGDDFRQERKLLSVSDTLAWLAQQRMAAEDWSEGIRVSLLTQKLKEFLFGESVDKHYINNRDNYKRVALSQILVCDMAEAVKIAQALREEKASFCALALEHSKGKQSQENGGFVGVRFLAELLPEISQAVVGKTEGEVIGPIQTKLGFHILRIEKWFSTEIKYVREQVLESLFQAWLNAWSNKKENSSDVNA